VSDIIEDRPQQRVASDAVVEHIHQTRDVATISNIEPQSAHSGSSGGQSATPIVDQGRRRVVVLAQKSAVERPRHSRLRHRNDVAPWVAG
jgi:hypothetical protein